MWLVGMMGSGKTSAGRMAASRLRVGFADTDEELERASGRSVLDIWGELGEPGFRRLEVDSIARLDGFRGIVATGGGAVLEAATRRVFATGTVVWLRASPEVLALRAGNVDRPMLRGGDPVETLDGLLRSREELYRAVSDNVIDTEGLAVEEVAARIEALWNE
jgi:shikimate kinase